MGFDGANTDSIGAVRALLLTTYYKASEITNDSIEMKCFIRELNWTMIPASEQLWTRTSLLWRFVESTKVVWLYHKTWTRREWYQNVALLQSRHSAFVISEPSKTF